MATALDDLRGCRGAILHLIADLEALLGRRVDVVAEGGLLERDGHILAEVVPL